MRRFLAVAILASGLCGSAQAAPDLRLDLSTFVSSTAGNWNNISNLTGTTNNLIDFPTGTATGVSISGAGSPWQNFFGDDAGSFPNQSWLTQPATVDGAGLQSGSTGSFVFSGLSASSTYSLELVSARTTFGYLNAFTVNGVQANRTFLGTPVPALWNSTTDGLTPGNWLIWDNIKSVNGTITVTDAATNGTLGIINAIRLVGVGASVPEPASITLLGMSMVGLLVFGGRKLRGNGDRGSLKKPDSRDAHHGGG